MCELLGMSFNQPVSPTISFIGLRHRGRINPDGWGLAFYPDSCAQVFKEPTTAEESQLADFLKDYPGIRSMIFVGHVRIGTAGPTSHKNTHPFNRELNGKEYVFAHNGTLDKDKYKQLETGRFKPIGDTDSEHVFCHLLHCIEKQGVTVWKEQDFAWLAHEITEINHSGKLNCIFSDGEFLFAYHDSTCYKPLHYVHRIYPHGRIRMRDMDWEIDLAEEKDPSQAGFVVATNPLTNESWEPFRPGEFVVFKGTMVYSNLRDIAESDGIRFTDLELKVLRMLRASPHRLKHGEILRHLGYPRDEVRLSIQSLLNKGYILQDSRDGVNWDHKDATFYTVTERQNEIDWLIRSRK